MGDDLEGVIGGGAAGDGTTTNNGNMNTTTGPSFDDAYAVADLFQPDLSREQKERLAKQFQENPAQFASARERLPKIVVDDIEQGLDSLSRQLSEAEQAQERAWTPKNPGEFYLPQEQRRMQFKQFTDTYFAWIVGETNAADYESKLLPLVRDRFKTNVISQLGTGTTELKTMAQRLEKLRARNEEDLVTLLGDIQQQDAMIDIAETRLRDLPGELDEAQKSFRSMSQAQGADYETASKQLNSLREERRTYMGLKREATNNVFVYNRQLERARFVLAQVAPLTDRVQDFAANMDLLRRSMDVAGPEPYQVLDPGTLKTLTGLYEKAKSILNALDKGFMEMAKVMEKSLPKSFSTGYEPQEMKLDIREQNERYLTELSHRTDKARAIAKDLRENGMPYLV